MFELRIKIELYVDHRSESVSTEAENTFTAMIYI